MVERQYLRAMLCDRMRRGANCPPTCPYLILVVISLQRAAEERRVGWRASMLLSHRFTGVWILTGIVALLFGVVVLPLAFAR